MAVSSLRAFSAVLAVAFFASSTPAQSEVRMPAEAAPDRTIGGDVMLDDLDVGAVEMFALTPADPPNAPGAVRPPRYLLTGHGDYQFDTNLDTAGDFSVARFRAGIGANVPLSDRLGVNAAAGYQLTSYDFDNAAGLGGGDPWGTCTSVTSWSSSITPSTSAGPPLAARCSHPRAKAARAFPSRRRAAACLGSGTGSPIGSWSGWASRRAANWRRTPPCCRPSSWSTGSMSTGSCAGGLDLGASSGVGLSVNHRFDEHWSVGGHIGFLQQRFRLDDSGIAPDGVGENQRSAVASGLTWTPQPQWQVGFQVGAQFDGELSVEDEQGDTLFTEDYDAGVFAGASVVLRF